MAYCRKCGKEIGDDYKLCPYCGEAQFSSTVNREISSKDAAAAEFARDPVNPVVDDGATPEAKALREIYEHYGAQQVLGNLTLLYNALGDILGEDGKKLRNQVRMAMDAGLGKLYLEQLKTPAPDFNKRSLALLTDEAGLGECAAKQIQELFHGMVGFATAKPKPQKPEPPKAAPPQSTPVADPKGQKKSNVAVIVAAALIIAVVIGVAAMYTNQIGPFAPMPTPVPETPSLTDVPTSTPTSVPVETPKADLTNLVVGDVVTFGVYEQDGDIANGKEGITWVVLDKDDDGCVLLISQYILAYKPFNESFSRTEWAESTLRTWLNNDFLQGAFTANERSQMEDHLNGDRVTLLSREEANLFSSTLLGLEDYTPEAAQTKDIYYGKTYDAWWLRSSGQQTSRAVLVHTASDEELILGTVQVDAGAGIRPVICIKTEQ